MGVNAPTMQVVSKHSVGKYNYRAACNEAVKEYLSWQGSDGKKTREPKLLITRECPVLMRTLPELIYNENDPNGMDFDSGVGMDDPYDAMKMGFMALRTPARPPEEKPKLTNYEKMSKIIAERVKRFSKGQHRWARV
jgi:hypothetical protein